MSACPVCGSGGESLVCEIRTGRIVRCGGCGTVRRGDLVTGEDYDRLYQNEAIMETEFYTSNKTAGDPNVEPMPTFRRGLDRLEKLVKPGRLLDIGCSYGAFMVAAQERGWKATGVELSRKTATYAREERGLDVFCGPLEQAQFPDGSFQAVTLWDVIEHFDDPLATLREVHRVLAPGGILLVFTINQASLLNVVGHAMYGASLHRWKRIMELFYDIHHNFFFDPATLAGLIRRSGNYEIADTLFGAANVRRWHTVPISPVMMLGSDVIDLLSAPMGRRYRILMFGQKRA